MQSAKAALPDVAMSRSDGGVTVHPEAIAHSSGRECSCYNGPARP